MKIQDTSSQDHVIQKKKMKPGTRLVLILVVLVVAAGLIAVPTLGLFSGADLSIERSRLRYAAVTRGDLVRDLSVDGRIVATSYPTLFSPAIGTISLEVRPGDRVSKDQVLARMFSPELENLLEQETSGLEAMDATLSSQRIIAATTNLTNRQNADLNQLKKETAIRELARSKKAFSEGLISQADYDKAADILAIAELEHKHAVENAALVSQNLEVEIHSRQKQLQRQQLVVDEARRRVAQLVLVSPVDGVVGSVSVDPHDSVIRNQEILTVVDLSAFEIEINIPEAYADEILPGSATEINYEGKTYAGSVTSVSPEVTGALVSGRVAFIGDLPHGLKQNQRVSTRIVLDTKTNTLMVRRGPFLESGAGRKAFVVTGNLAQLRPISIGVSSLTDIEILSGLEEGETIVISDTARFAKAETVLLRD